MKSAQDKINEAKKKLTELKIQLKKEQNKSDWIKIPELKIEVQSKIHHKGKSYDELKEEFGEEFLEKSLLTYNQLKELRNLEYNGKYDLGLKKTWEFVKQEDLFMKEKGHVARFCAGSGYADLDCGGDSSCSYSNLGVRWVRRTKGKKK